MSAPPSAFSAPAFSRSRALALVAAGFALFLALVWLIAAGAQMGGGGNNGQAHAAAKGLNGYAGLARLLEAEGYEVTRSRSPAGLATTGLLVLTPPPATDPAELAKLLRERVLRGPTLVILPKWSALRPPPDVPREVRAAFKPGWVLLGEALPLEWPAKLITPFGFEHRLELREGSAKPRWRGLGAAGVLPTASVLYAVPKAEHVPLLVDDRGRALAIRVAWAKGDKYYTDAHWPVFLAEPDLANNYGLADRARAAAALALVRAAAGDRGNGAVTFDLTLNGLGAAENLLTLAFRPPFLAATICLLLALVIIAWRAFLRFGPAATAGGPAIAFGKARLVANGAELILRARRLRLLGAPYAALSARTIAARLGLARADPPAIDAALARRLPGEEPFSRRAARLEAAETPAELLGAARALDELTAKLRQG